MLRQLVDYGGGVEGGLSHFMPKYNGLPWWLWLWGIHLQCRRPGFNPQTRKTPWRREWLLIPAYPFLPGEFHGQRSLAGYSPCGPKESDVTNTFTFSFFTMNLRQIWEETFFLCYCAFLWSLHLSCSLGYMRVCQGCILSPYLFNWYAEYTCEMLGWMKHKLESRLPGEISITSDMQMTHHPYGRKGRRTKEPLDESERGEWKSWLKSQHSEN